MRHSDCEIRKTFFLAVPALEGIFALTGCQQPAPPPPPDTRAADEAAIRSAEAEMAKAAAPMDSAKMVSFYTEDVVGMAADAPVTQGKQNMLQYFEAMSKKEEPSISWTPTKIEVARSGDLAYSWGTGEISAKDAKGKDVKGKVKYVSVWKKQADGSWKIAVDTMLPDPPAKQ